MLLLILTGCNIFDPSTHKDERLIEFVEIIKYEADIRGCEIPKLKVVLGNLGEFVQGRYTRTLTEKKITISKWFYYENIDVLDYQIEQTLLHEYGHAMGKKHTDGKYEIMNPNRALKSSDVWFGLRDEVYNTFFGREPL